MGKISFLGGVAVGYVLGARAGRQRYEQIKRAALGVWSSGPVQSGVDTAKETVRDQGASMAGLVGDAAKQAGSAAREKVSHSSAKAAGTPSASTPGAGAETGGGTPATNGTSAPGRHTGSIDQPYAGPH